MQANEGYCISVPYANMLQDLHSWAAGILESTEKATSKAQPGIRGSRSYTSLSNNNESLSGYLIACSTGSLRARDDELDSTT